MLDKILKLLITDRTDVSATLLRLALGGVMFPHGAQKVFGWFGGQGFPATVISFRDLGIPTALAVAVVFAEFLGSIALIIGLGSRIAALGIGIVMTGAVGVHLSHGFFMNWYGAQSGEGFEYHLLALGLVAGIVARGGGAFSVDAQLTHRK